MKNVIILFTIILGGFGINTNVQAQSETRNLSEFSDMSVSAGIEVILHESNKNYADVTLKNADSDDLIIDVKGDKCVIKWESGWNGWKSNNRSATVELYYTNLDGISASSGSKVESDGTVRGEDFDVDVSSGAHVSIDLECNDLDVDVSSGAFVRLEGSARNQRVDVSSGASYKGSDMVTQSTNASASSGASAKVHATEKFEGDSSSGGSIKYAGDPKETDINSSKWSGGSIRKM